MNKFRFDIDVVGACNLRCPSCPQGNMKEFRLPQGRMEASLLEDIIQKAVSECLVESISLFSWCEPLLHTGIHDLIRIVKNSGISCYMSSNLNILPDADAIMLSNPDYYKISVSGFTQDVYGYSHRGGNIELVKKHMVELREAKIRNNATTRIVVNYHRYKHNLKEEPLMRQYASDLGFEFDPAWALMLPIEKILAYPDGDNTTFFNEEDHQLVSQLALPFPKTLAASTEYRTQPCRLREEHIMIDFQGNVLLCCGVFNSVKYNLGRYLDIPLDAIQNVRHEHNMCGRCISSGAHVYLTYGTPGIEKLILENITEEDTDIKTLRREFLKKRIELFLQKIYQRFFSGFISKKQIILLKTQFNRLYR